MAEEVAKFTFSASGQESVKAAFKSIERAAQQASRNAVRAAKEQQRATVKAANAGAKNAQARARDQRRQQIREANATARAHKQAQANQLRSERAFARERTRIAKQQQRELMRITKETTRQIERARETKRESRGARRSAIAGLGAGAALGIGGAAIGLGAAALGRGGQVVGQAARESINLQDRSIRLAIKGGGTDKFNPTLIRQTLEDTTRNVKGVKSDDLAAALESFVGKTGNLQKGLDFSEVFAQISIATGTAAEEVGSAAADLFEKFDIKSVEGMNKALSTLAVQGKRGSFELEDAAKQFPKLAAAAKRFGLEGEEGVATLGGLAQLSKSGTGGGETAASAVEATLRQLVSKSGVIKKRFGVDVFTDKGQTKARNIKDVLVETISSSKGSLPELQKVFGEEGIRGISGLISTFNQAKAGATGTEAERTAEATKKLRDAINGAIDATGAEAEIKRDSAAAQTQTSAQLTAAWESLRSEVGENVAPALVKVINDLIPVVESLDFSVMADDLSELGGAAKKAAEFLGLLSKKKDIERDVRKTSRNERVAAAKFARLSKKADKPGGISNLNVDELRELANAGVSLTKAEDAKREAGKKQQARNDFIAKASERGLSPDKAKLLADQIIDNPLVTQKTGLDDLLGSAGLEQSKIGELGRTLATEATGTTFDDKGRVAELGAGIDPEVAAKANSSISGLDGAAKAAVLGLEGLAGVANSIFFD